MKKYYKKLQKAIAEYMDMSISFYDASTDGFCRGLTLGLIALMDNQLRLSLINECPYFPFPWGNEDTGRILEILAKHNVKVTFFMTGGWMNKYPEDVKAIMAAGHDLGNHSQNHKQMSTLSLEQCKKELTEPHQFIKELTGQEMNLFRPPYGDYDDTVLEAAKECGYYAVQWDVDSLDWKDYGVDSIIRTVTQHKHLGNGSIILMHNGAKYTPDALDSIITILKEKGYEFVPISELIIKENYEMDHEGRQHSKPES